MPWRRGRKGAFMTHTVIGTPATCAEQMERFMRDCALDGLMLIFADYRRRPARDGTGNPAAAAKALA